MNTVPFTATFKGLYLQRITAANGLRNNVGIQPLAAFIRWKAFSRMSGLSCFLIFTFSQGNAQPAENSSFPGAAFIAALIAGDRAYAHFDNRAALEAYGQAVALDSSNYETLWKLTRACVDVGNIVESDSQKQLYLTGEYLARSSVKLYPDSAQGHFYLAVALGRVALHAGGKQKIRLSKEVKAEAEKTLALYPRHDGAMHVLGRWNYELGNLSWTLKAFAKALYGGVPSGGNEEARGWFERAIAVNPDWPAHHLWLGETLVKLEQYEAARAHLQKCLDLPQVFWEDPRNKRQAQKTLAAIKDKK